MTGLLVSVRNAEEAWLAFGAGADLIDVKEPQRGPLGRADRDTVDDVVDRLCGQVPVSVAMGELVDWRGPERGSVHESIGYAKLGLARCAPLDDWDVRWIRAIRSLPASTSAVAVSYADWRWAKAPPPLEVVDRGAQLGCGAFLIDTYDKSRGDLLAHCDLLALAGLVQRCRTREMLVVLAGSLSMVTIPVVLSLGIDYVAVRGAACAKGRTDDLDAGRVRDLARLVRGYRSGSEGRTRTVQS